MYYRIFDTPQPYPAMTEYQEQMREKVRAEELGEGIILFLEHQPVYTLGLRGTTVNLLWNEETCTSEGISIHRTKRGGDITYHGPGQLVIYPVLDIRKLRFPSVKAFVVWWGQLFVELLNEEFGVAARWNEEKTGVWTDRGKIVAAGLHFRHFISAHGFALNLQPDMRHFSGIIPCGLAGAGVTTLFKETGRHVGYREMAELILRRVNEKLQTDIMEIRE